MFNRGMGGVSAIFVARAIVFDFDSALGTFSEEILEGLTGLPIAILSKMEGKIEQVSRLAERIENSLQKMRTEGYTLKEGGLSKKALELAAEDTLRDELEILSKLGMGSHDAKARGEDQKSDKVIPYSRSHKYRQISIRKTAGMAVRRGRGRMVPEDLRSFEMSRKSGVDFVFVLDSSGSMRGEKMDSCKRAAIGLAAVSVGSLDRIGVIAFRKEPEVICEFSDSEDLPLFAEKIVSLTPGGMTSISKAVSLAAGILSERTGASAKHILLITDGLPTDGEKPGEEAKEQVSKARAEGMTVSVAGIGLTSEGESLARELAGLGEGNFYNVGAKESELTGIVLSDREKLSS